MISIGPTSILIYRKFIGQNIAMVLLPHSEQCWAGRLSWPHDSCKANPVWSSYPGCLYTHTKTARALQLLINTQCLSVFV